MLLAGCLCLSVMLASCGKRTDVEKEDPFIYCLNEDRTGLTKISYDFPEGNAEETARAVLEELKEPAEEIEYTAPIPKEVKVQGCRLRGSILDVDFNSAYLEMGALEEKLVRAAVVQSLDVRYSSNVSREKLIVEKLMQGPSGSGAYPMINPDANLLSVTIKDGICYVNFDSTFLTGAYDVLPEVTVYSIVNSLVEGTEAQQVQITINGETDAKYMETVDLSQPLEAKEELVAAEK